MDVHLHKKKKKDKIPQKDVNRFKDSYIIHKKDVNHF